MEISHMLRTVAIVTVTKLTLAHAVSKSRASAPWLMRLAKRTHLYYLSEKHAGPSWKSVMGDDPRVEWLQAARTWANSVAGATLVVARL